MSYDRMRSKYLYKPRITSSILRIGQATLRWFERVVQNGMMVGFTGLFPRNSEMTLGNVLLCAKTLSTSRVKWSCPWGDHSLV